FVDPAADRRTHSRGEITTRDVLHDEIEATQSIVVEVIVDRRNRGMFKRRQQQRLAFEIANRFFMLPRIEMRLHHLLDCARRVAEIAILREINRAHAAATDAPNDLVATVQYRVRGELFYCWTMAAGRALFRRRGSGRFDVIRKRTTQRVGRYRW